MRQAAIRRLRAWAARRHGRDSLPIKINRRRIYILPTRFGIMLAFVLIAMMMAGLNYNSNLGLAFAFLMVSVALVTMHHCNRNLLGLQVDVTTEVDAFAGREASFEFVLRNESNVERRDVEIRCLTASGMRSVAAKSSESIPVAVPVPQRGVARIEQFELRTRYPFGWFHAWTYVQGSLTAYVAPSPHGDRTLPAVGGVGTASRSEARGGEAAVQSYTSLASQPDWLEWSSLEGQETEMRLSQLCLWVLESDAAQRVYGLRIPGREIPPGRGAAHRFACLRALALYGFADPR